MHAAIRTAHERTRQTLGPECLQRALAAHASKRPPAARQGVIEIGQPVLRRAPAREAFRARPRGSQQQVHHRVVARERHPHL